MQLETIDDALQRLHEYIPNTVSMRKSYNLERMRQFLVEIGNPQDTLRVIHIAGTSGKTSTAYFIRALLQDAGCKTGLTVSPHIVTITERVQIDGQPLPDAEFLSYLRDFLVLVEGSAVQLTYFEVLVAFAYWVFAKEAVDYVVVETGLGGLLDGTNVVGSEDKICVITDLGLDHTEILGETLEDIAYQKAGIIQPGNQALLIDQEPAAVRVILGHVKRQAATATVVPSPPADGAVADLPSFQRRNWTLAQATYEFLAARDGLPKLSASAIVRGLQAQPPGRMERFTVRGKTLFLDGAHNPQKLGALRQALGELGISSVAVLASFVTAPDRKLDATMTELIPFTSHLIIPNFMVLQDLAKQSPPAEELAARAKRLGIKTVEVRPELPDAFSALLVRPESTLLVTGSLYLVSQVRLLAQEASR